MASGGKCPINSINQKWHALCIGELKAAGGDKWERFKASVESAYNELEGAFKKLKS